ncbi:protein FAR1-RELATED SEQUENCE 11-like [Chenopodium quinoa]|uniref:protein FAR1-RELATED SEQUENCE 11-like n=1 Tax=Chenopodium quinoa TaxID=63459 RepID=UPI000B785363|nr:protein FAR1-RELATED SEQUENCE 11-like [Chenopodium quinoa]XP_021730272.1 protein FAR1-RELATED SEQUENCE 11-like [Chenopodium quinoa]XP_021730273.1 protein FAR1-RELATED SEQUENCE 11-like [Chenopodium quinoa]
MTVNGSQNMESSENETDLSQDNIESVEEIPEDAILSRQTSVNLVPFIGQRFVSQDAAYEFYCSFAKQCGFSIRRHRTRGKDGVGRGVTRRDFTCHRGGHPQAKPSEEGKLQRNRKSSRCGCQAYMRIVKRSDLDVPEWRVTGFSNNHNHELLKSVEVQIPPSHCTISADDKSRICLFAKAGMSARQMLRLMELEKGVKLGCLPFTELNIRDLLQSFRHVDKDNDAIDLISMCKRLKDENSYFKYDFKLDGHNRLEHIAWSYPSSIQKYEAFGDAILLDTNHRLDAYDMLLGLLMGVDNHGKACLYSCVLLRNENLESFTWALKTFLCFMKGKAPQTILTDQNIWLKEAIACEMPETKHAFSIWHIIANLSDWFSLPLGSHYDGWKTEFYRLYSLEMVDEFEAGWKEMVDRYGLQSNKYIICLYALRDFWALSFLRRYFFAGLMSRSVTDSINALIQRILSAQSTLDCFIDEVANIAEYDDHGGSKLKMQQNQKVSLKTGSPMESHAATVFTPFAFSLLQEELVSAPQYASIMVGEGCFQIRHHTEMDGGCKVMWNPSQELIHCSCHQFEFLGILCRHILRVLSTNNCFRIPDPYLPLRWRLVSNEHIEKEQTDKAKILEAIASTIVSESVITEERLTFACEHMSMVLAHIKQLPKLSNHHETNEMGINSSAGLLIIPGVEGSAGISQCFSLGNPHESFLVKLKEQNPNPGLENNMSRKRRRAIPPCEQYAHDACDSAIIEGNTGGDAFGGFL